MLKIVSGLLLFGVLSNAKNHAEIGNYPKVSMESCGLTAIINKKSPINERIVNGENASLGEFPWITSIKLTHRSWTFWCGGAIINQYWILTSIDCFRLENIPMDEFDVSVLAGSLIYYEGIQIKAKKVYLHEKFDPQFKLINDIALIELTSEMKPAIESTYYTINGICLPKAQIVNDFEEEALFSGWGNIDLKGNVSTKYLKKAKYKINPLNVKCAKKQICSYEVDHPVCTEDIGSPLIQFVGNRAVVIGIYSRITSDRVDCNPTLQYFTRVSQFIDWILSKINENSQKNGTTDELTSRKTGGNASETSESNDEMKAVIIVASIFVILFIIAIFLMTIVIVIKHKNKSKFVSFGSSGPTLRSGSETSFNEPSVQTIHSQTGIAISSK